MADMESDNEWDVSSPSESEEDTKKKRRKRKKIDSDSDEYIPPSDMKKNSPVKRKVTVPKKRGPVKKAVNSDNPATVASDEQPSLSSEIATASSSGISSTAETCTDDAQKPKRRKVDPKAPKTRKPRTVKPKAVKPAKKAAEKVKPDGTCDIDEITSKVLPAHMDWDDAELLSHMQQVDLWIARNVKQLFDQDNTIPFIARYRKELTNSMDAEKLRYMKDSYDLIKTIKQRAAAVINAITKLGKLTPELERLIRCARSMSELDFIYTPFKPGSKRTLAERARQLGLEPAALTLLEGKQFVSPDSLVQPNKDGLKNVGDVELGLQHIIADVMSKNKDLLDKLRLLRERTEIRITTDKAKAAKTAAKKAKEESKVKNEKNLFNDKKPFNEKKPFEDHKKSENDESKFQLYFQFNENIRFLRPHQVLAINRGEKLKILSVKFVVNEWLMRQITDFSYNYWYRHGLNFPLRNKILQESIKDAYNRLLQPLIVRQIRSELNQKAERASIDVFATNLKHLLLLPPVKGKKILGIDPGYRNGCKLGLISSTGEILETDVIYPSLTLATYNMEPEEDFNAKKLKLMLLKHSCELIALGNGTACREMEGYLSYLIQRRWFLPLDVQFTIINEQGASIYSCSPLAQKEFPKMDPNLISAVSLARRAQDPLAELVKVEPKHLGVGMYQHDVPEKQLHNTLDEVVIECVSFVGVDINTASDVLLRRVAGLNAARATKLLQWRSDNGPFRNRQQILKVKGIGEKTFQQCAGFIRIIPETYQKSEMPKFELPSTSKSSTDDTENPLDRTWIHPESYSVAERFIQKCGVQIADLGRPYFIDRVRNTVTTCGLSQLATEFSVAVPQMKLICDGLQQHPEHDFRTENQAPLFRRTITSLSDLRVGMILTGRVQNVTHFGAFVDIGVGRDGLIPIKMYRGKNVQLGQRVEVKVLNIELERKRINLDLVRIM